MTFVNFCWTLVMEMDCFIARTEPGHSLLILSVLTEAIKRYSWGCDGRDQYLTSLQGTARLADHWTRLRCHLHLHLHLSLIA